MKLIQKTQSPDFGRRLRRIMQSKLKFCTFLILNYKQDRSPISIYRWIPDDELRQYFQDNYLTGYYKLDPYYKINLGSRKSGLHQLKEIAPDRFFTTEYYRKYYRDTRLVDEIGTTVIQSDGSHSGLSMSRDRNAAPFTKQEIGNLRRIGPILNELIRQHYEAIYIDSSKETQYEKADPLDQILYWYTRDRYKKSLTRRETQIAAMVLEGHSSLSIGLVLKISGATVKVHRKNIYKKLKISSQAELFSVLHLALDMSAASNPTDLKSL